MAGTIQSITGITHANGGLSVNVGTKTKSITQTEQSAYNNTQVIGTSAETITQGDVTTLGVIIVENLDSVNFVDVGPDASGLVDAIRLLAGERYVFRSKPGVVWKAKADTAPVRMQVTIYGA